LLFFIVTRDTPGTGLTPSLAIALRDFFSLRLCLLREPGVPSSAPRARTPRQARPRLGTALHRCRDRLGSAASHGRAVACRSSRQHKCTGGVQSAVAGTPGALPGSARVASRGRAPPSSPSSAASSSSLLRSESSLSMSCRARPGHARRRHGAASEVGLQEPGSAHLHVVGLQLRPRHTGTRALTPPALAYQRLEQPQCDGQLPA